MIVFKKQNFWFNQPVFDESESAFFEIPANHSQGRLARGGKLFGSAQRLVFVPNRVDAKLGGHAVSITIDQITKVSKEPRSWSIFELFSGALVPRMALQLRDGTRHLFVVKHLDHTIASLLWFLEEINRATELEFEDGDPKPSLD